MGMGDEARRAADEERANVSRQSVRQQESLQRWKRDVASLADEYGKEAREARIPVDVRVRLRGYWVLSVPTYDTGEYWASEQIAIGRNGDLARAWRRGVAKGSGASGWGVRSWFDPTLPSGKVFEADKEQIRTAMIRNLTRRMCDQP